MVKLEVYIIQEVSLSVNEGIAPPDYNSEVGKVRATLGDTAYEPLDPAQAGKGDYALFSDAEIETFINVGGSFEGAVALGYNSLATSAALEAKSVKDHDLSVDLTKRASELRALASMWDDKARAISSDIFETFDVVAEGDTCYPELATRPVLWL